MRTPIQTGRTHNSIPVPAQINTHATLQYHNPTIHQNKQKKQNTQSYRKIAAVQVRALNTQCIYRTAGVITIKNPSKPIKKTPAKPTHPHIPQHPCPGQTIVLCETPPVRCWEKPCFRQEPWEKNGSTCTLNTHCPRPISCPRTSIIRDAVATYVPDNATHSNKHHILGTGRM